MAREEERVGSSGEEMESRLGELERIADSLHDVPDEELSLVLERAVGLLREVNADIEARAAAAGRDAEAAEALLDGVDFAAFDGAMRDLAPMEPVDISATEGRGGEEG